MVRKYIVSQTITYQTNIYAESVEEAHDMFMEMGLNDMPIVDTSDIDVVEEGETAKLP